MIHFLEKYGHAIARGLILLGLLLMALASSAQIRLRVELDADNVTYRVYMTSTVSFSGLQSVMATAQVTLSVPHDTGPDRFVVTNLTTAIPGMRWAQSDRADGPAENPDWDYLFFSFINDASPLVQFPIVAGQDKLLFTFQRKGNCLGRIEVSNNGSDPFRVPNSLGINTGNSVAILGVKGNAYADSPDLRPKLDLRTSATTVCAGEPVLLEADLSGTSSVSYVYQWFVGDQPLGPASPSPVLSHTFTTTASGYQAVVRLRASEAGGSPCQRIVLSANRVIDVKPAPLAEVPYTGSPCAPLPLTLSTTPQAGATYQWLRDRQTLPGQTGAALSVEQSGTYEVQATLTDCTTSSLPVSIVGSASGNEVSIALYPAPVVLAGKPVQLQAEVQNAQSVSWSPANLLDRPDVASPIARLSQTTTFTLTARSAEGCEVSDTVTVQVTPPLYVPTAFSPNGDGINDNWEIQNAAQYALFRVNVFNRWGDRVFQNDTYQTPWDGRDDGGPVDAGLYFYTIQTPQGSYQGWLTVLK